MYRFLISYKCKSRIRRRRRHRVPHSSCGHVCVCCNVLSAVSYSRQPNDRICGLLLLWIGYYVHTHTPLRKHCLFSSLNCCCGSESMQSSRISQDTECSVPRELSSSSSSILCFCLHKLHSLNYCVGDAYIFGLTRRTDGAHKSDV